MRLTVKVKAFLNGVLHDCLYCLSLRAAACPRHPVNHPKLSSLLRYRGQAAVRSGV